MDVEALIQDSKTGIVYDVSELFTEATWETTLIEQPGKFTLNYVNDNYVEVSEGSSLSFKVNGQGVFFGYVFKRGKKYDDKVSVTAYDQMRYMKNKDTYVLSNMTASQIFEKLCGDFKLHYKVVDASSYIVLPRVNDNKTLFEINQHALDETLINVGEWYVIRDNFGVVEFININSLKTMLVFGDYSNTTGYDYESSIDDDTYNQVKLVQENKDTKKREVYIIKDSDTIKQWGTLQYFEKVDEKANAAQIQERGDRLLKLKNRVTKTLKLPCLGDLQVFAGSGIVLGISDLQKEDIPINQYFMVTKSTHKFINDYHTMQLEVQVTV